MTHYKEKVPCTLYKGAGRVVIGVICDKEIKTGLNNVYIYFFKGSSTWLQSLTYHTPH